MFNPWLKKLSTSLIALVLIFVMMFHQGTGVSAESLSELKERQEELAAEKAQIDERLEELNDDVGKKKEYRDEIYAQIEVIQEEIEVLKQQIKLLNEKIYTAEDAISQQQSGIDESYELLKERIRALYISGDASAMTVLLKSENLLDYMEKARILQAITEHDSQLIESFIEKRESIQEELDIITADKETLSEKKKLEDQKCAELGELYEQAQRLVLEAEDAQEAAAANSDLLSTQIASTEAAIAELEDEIKAQYGDGAVNLGGTGYEGTGNFIWPMPGYTYITCYYGDGGHRGIDIAGGDIYGKAIIAADSGFVEYAGWNDSYGYCVFINHGNGYETRYAHMSSLGISTGAYVSSGETIGFVGSTGNSTGPHLHFEVIYGGSTTNPFNYF